MAFNFISHTVSLALNKSFERPLKKSCAIYFLNLYYSTTKTYPVFYYNLVRKGLTPANHAFRIAIRVFDVKQMGCF